MESDYIALWQGGVLTDQGCYLSKLFHIKRQKQHSVETIDPGVLNNSKMCLSMFMSFLGIKSGGTAWVAVIGENTGGSKLQMDSQVNKDTSSRCDGSVAQTF